MGRIFRDLQIKKRVKKWGVATHQNMSYALSTNKRKFYRLLDAASNASDRSLPIPNSASAGMQADNEPLSSKRARPRNASVIGMYAMSRDNSSYSGSIASKRPSYIPADRKAFLERLESFQDLDKWQHFRVPEAINAALWAKRGWRAVAEYAVGCATCLAEVSIMLPGKPPETSDEGRVLSALEGQEWEKTAVEQLIEKYRELIIAGHGENCPWKNKGCDETIQRLPLAHSKQALDALRNRYDSLVELAAVLPPQINPPEGLDMNRLCSQFSLLARTSKKMPIPMQASDMQPPQALWPLAEGSPAGKGKAPDTSSLAALPAEGQDHQQAYQIINPQALTLALFGWQAEKDHPAGKLEEGLVTCRACFLRQGLWFYRKGEADYHGNTKTFEPTDHREFCPWTHGSIQSGRRESQSSTPEPELSGWQVLLNVIDTAHASALRRGGDSINSSTDQFTSARANQRSSHEGAATNEADSVGSVDGADDDAELQRKDKDMRARFKQLRRVFTAKRTKSAGKENVDVKKTKSNT